MWTSTGTTKAQQTGTTGTGRQARPTTATAARTETTTKRWREQKPGQTTQVLEPPLEEAPPPPPPEEAPAPARPAWRTVHKRAERRERAIAKLQQPQPTAMPAPVQRPDLPAWSQWRRLCLR
jgi:hypothetical protein